MFLLLGLRCWMWNWGATKRNFSIQVNGTENDTVYSRDVLFA